MNPATNTGRWRRLLPQRALPWWQGLALAGLCVAAATGVRMLLEPAVGEAGIPFIAYFPAVLVAAVWGGFVGGSAAVAGATVMAWALFIPREAQGPSVGLFWTMGTFVVSTALLVVVGALLGRSVRDLRRSEEHLNTLAEELSHRAKNGFAVVQAIVSQSARGAETVKDFERTLSARLAAMAQAQDLVSGDPDETARLEDIIPSVLAPFDLKRFEIDHAGRVVAARNLSLALALIFHELATNAVKYGALSSTGGKVALKVNKLESGRAQVIWRESGGPQVALTNKQGFGARLMQTALAQHDGGSELKFEPEGLIAILTFRAA